MDKKEEELRKELAGLEEKLTDSTFYSGKDYPKVAKRKQQLDAILGLFDQKNKLLKSNIETEELSQSPDEELSHLPQNELATIKSELEKVSENLVEALTPQDPNDE